MQKQLHEINNMSVRERAALFERLSIYPALTLMVFTRRGIGFRTLHPVAIAVVTFAMWMIAAMTDSSAMPKVLYYHGWAFAIFAGVQRVTRWWQFRRNVRQHSYYLGTSIMEVRWPKFVYRWHVITRWVEPLLWCVVAFFLFGNGYKAEAFWIAFCALCLRTIEEAVHRKQRDRDMDMVDGLIMSEINSGTVEQFSEAGASAASAAVASGNAISTGLSPELKAMMARRSKQPGAATTSSPTQTSVPATQAKAGITVRRIVTALAIALALDASQGLMGWALVKMPYFQSWLWWQWCIPAAVADLIAAIASPLLLRFHWRFVSTFVLELVPILNLLPMWTLTVAVVAWIRRKEITKSPPRAASAPIAATETALSVVVPPTFATPQELPLILEPLPPVAAAAAPSVQTIVVEPRADAAPSPEAEIPPNLFLTRESIVIAVLIVPALLLAFWLLHGLRRPEAKADVPGISGTDQLTQVMTKSAQRQANAAKRRCERLVERFDAVTKPGPEPDWLFHPADHAVWVAQTKLYASIAHEFQRDLEEAKQAQEDAVAELANLTADLAGVSNPPAVQSEVRGIWARYIVPPLHILLAFSLFRFTARTLFRFLLLKDRIGAIQL